MSNPEGTVEFVLLGSGAVRANVNRAGPAQVVRVGRRTMLLDCGRNAVHQLAARGFAVEAIDGVFVTHLHFDHVCDLPHLVLLGWNNGRDRPLNVYGPDGLAHFVQHGLREAY
ncbi:MAG: MBL fold metallo-hydrolase, partial [Planctomycetota bacterium]